MTTDAVGGVWTFTMELACGLLDKGCEIALVSFGREPSEEQRRWAAAMRAGPYGKRFRFIGSDAPLEWMQDNEQAYSGPSQLLLATTLEFEPEVMHANQFCFGALPISCPKLITAHSNVFSWADACRQDALPESAWLVRYRRLAQAGLEAAHIVIAPTCSALDELARHFTLRKGTTYVVPNGRLLSLPQYARRKTQAVTAGRIWDEAKNIRMLEEVVSPIPIVVAGECAFENIYLAPHSAGLHHLGSLSENDLLSLFLESEIYICTSKYEPFGLAPLEAALCGCAVLANDLPSLREVWDDAALYFNDAASLSKILSQLYKEPRYLEDRQARCLARAQLYSRERMVTGYLNLYCRLLAEGEGLIDVS